MTVPAAQPPAWYARGRQILLIIYGSIIAGCIVGAMLLGLVGMIVYRDFGSYTLSGNPFAATSFPWYEIDGMRLMAIAGVAIVGGIGFVVSYAIALIVVGQLFRRGLFSGPVGRVLAALLALFMELVAISWFLRLI